MVSLNIICMRLSVLSESFITRTIFLFHSTFQRILFSPFHETSFTKNLTKFIHFARLAGLRIYVSSSLFLQRSVLTYSVMSAKIDAKEAVFKYLKHQNRPYSANDIMINLHSEFGKSAIQKALDDLTRENKVVEKVYGKQKIYAPLQEETDASQDMETELLQLDSKIEEISEKLKTAENELKVSEAALKLVRTQPSMEECVRERQALEEDVKKLTDKLDGLSKLEVNVTKEDRDQIHKDSETYLKEYRKRKRICMDILNSILENCPKTKKSLIEEIGIETDEGVNFQLPA